MAQIKEMVSTVTKRDEKIYFFDGEKVTVQENLADIPRSAKVALTTTDQDFISYNFDLSKDLPEDSIEESVEIKMYQEAGLNSMLDYKISYHYVDSLLDKSKINVQAYAIAHTTLEKNCKEILDQFGYVDLILPTTSLPTVLYTEKILEPEDDLYLYFVKDNLYLSVFKDGELVYGKTLDTGLKKLVDDFVKSTGEHIKYEELINILVTKGVNEDNYSLEDKRFAIDFKDLLTNVAGKMNSILQYAMRLFNITTFSRVFVGTKNGPIPGGPEFFEEILGIQGFDYIFYSDLFLKGDEYVDQRDHLLLLELQNALDEESEKNPYNVTIYKRPSSFLKRSGGKFIAVVLIALLISLVVPLSIYINAVYKESIVQNRLSELKLNKQEFNQFKQEEQRLTNERKTLGEKLKSSKDYYQSKKELLETIYSKKVNKKSVVNFVNNIFGYVNKNNLTLKSIDYSEEQAILEVKADKQKQITGFVKSMVDDEYQVYMESISKVSGSYNSTVRVEIK